MKKAFFSALLGLLFALPAHASVIGVGYGDLIKLKDDHDPATTSDKVVYYLDRDWHRHPFPNLKVFQSWYFDFLNVKELSLEDMAQFQMAKPITYRPGTRLVKLASIPKVYAVEPGGTLRWITSESVAKTLYGNDWNKRVDDVDESFFSTYREGVPLLAPIWPTGSVVRRASDRATFVIDGLTKHPLTDETQKALRVYDRHVITTSDDLSAYDDAAAPVAGDWKYLDTSEDVHVETSPSTVFTFPQTSVTPTVGASRTLATINLTIGSSVIVRGLTFGISGPLFDGAVPRLKNLHVVDESGNDVYGIQQLPVTDEPAVSLTFSGAFTMKDATAHTLSLVADVDAATPVGTRYDITLFRDTVKLADGSNGEAVRKFWPPVFPAFDVTIKK
jgi:hypothetical protein